MTSKIEQILSTVNGATFVSIDTTTVPKLLGGKKNPMQGRIRKHMQGASVMVFQNKNANGYENMVARRLVKEGKAASDFTLGERTWGERIPNMPLVTYKDALYLEVIFLHSGAVSYTLDGNPIALADIEGTKDTVEGEQGGLNDKVIIRTFKLSSVDRIRINGTEHGRADIMGDVQAVA